MISPSSLASFWARWRVTRAFRALFLVVILICFVYDSSGFGLSVSGRMGGWEPLRAQRSFMFAHRSPHRLFPSIGWFMSPSGRCLASLFHASLLAVSLRLPGRSKQGGRGYRGWWWAEAKVVTMLGAAPVRF